MAGSCPAVPPAAAARVGVAGMPARAPCRHHHRRRRCCRARPRSVASRCRGPATAPMQVWTARGRTRARGAAPQQPPAWCGPAPLPHKAT
eukprot:366314-Chlamydomonas_euryale.AAC.2